MHSKALEIEPSEAFPEAHFPREAELPVSVSIL